MFITVAWLYILKWKAQTVASMSASVFPQPHFGINASFSLLRVTLSAQKYIAAFGLKPSHTPDSTFQEVKQHIMAYTLKVSSFQDKEQ